MTPEILPQIEERILRFWKDRGIFGKSLALRQAQGKPFRFFEGPPTANAGPGIHHVLSRIFKDIICRYKTMRGFYVERKAGWDTHGLPVEIQIEKELGIRHKSEIEKFGVAAFNKKARESVWRYKDEWEKFTDRIGFWLDMEHPYITYETPYMETLWYIIQQFWKKGLFAQDYKVVPYCPRCETPLSSHELAQGYETVKDPSVYLKLKIKNAKGKTPEYLLVWTTTPWTLPGNVAVAVNPGVTYTKYRIGNEFFWSVVPPPFENADDIEVTEKRSGKSLVGLEYEPIFDTGLKGKAWRVSAADFVSTEEGTGFVHIAPAFGEEDMNLGRQEKLPVVMNVSSSGRFAFSEKELKLEPFFRKLQGLFVKDADPMILEELKRLGILYRGDLKGTEHEYPFCWRCHTPLLYYAHKSWFVRMSRLREKLIAANRKINWIPTHFRDGRFGEWLREVKDWAFSRERYWGTPLPIWECNNGHRDALGSIKELNERAYEPNRFFVLRHAEGDHNVKDYIATWPEPKAKTAHLTEKGKRDTEAIAKILARKQIDLIVSSDLTRMKETVGILTKHLHRVKVVYEPRLRELDCGIFNYKSTKAHHAFFKKPIDEFTKRPPGGENLTDAQTRYFMVWHELNKMHRGKNILILGHGDPLWVFEGKVRGLSPEEILKLSYIEPGEWRELPKNDLPYDEEGEINLHRPYVDELLLECGQCGKPMKRVSEVADVWYDSGSMPFAQWHWPFENKERIAKGISFPADYIAEAVDQTRGWFYTLLAVSVALGFETPPYLNVICLGHILDEKGEKMSKSKGNIVNPWDMIAKYGVDSIRWYFYTVNPPGEPKRFAERDLAKNHQELALVLNVLNFFKTYSPRKIHADPFAKSTTPLDKWILAKLADTTESVTRELESYEVGQAARIISKFFDDLSRWYVRRSRRRFQKPKSGKELGVAAAVLGTVMLDLAKLMAPFTPFLAEHIWKETTPHFAKKLPESVHLALWPKPKKLSGRATILTAMEAVRDLAALGLKARHGANIKVRQPLATFEILHTPDSVHIPKELLALIAEELNVHAVKIVPRLSRGESWVRVEEPQWKVGLNTAISEELKIEGELRELTRHIQELRQDLALQPKNRIAVRISTDKTFETAIRRKEKEIKAEVGAKDLAFGRGKFGAEHEYARGDGGAVWVAIKKLP